MELKEYAGHDGVGLGELLARGEVGPGEVVEAALGAAEQVNPALGAVIETWTGEPTVEAATPLAGVPVMVKDIGVAVAGRRSELGSRLAAGRTSRSDSAIARRLRDGGLALVGRTTTPELAASTTTENALHGTTRNPWDLRRTPGGSSGGAAAAVAAGIVPVAHATDAAGSIRIPASCCGLVGLKPSRGRVSNAPGGEVLGDLGVQLGVSRTVRDSAALLDILAGGEPGDPYRIAPAPGRFGDQVDREPRPLRIAVMDQAWGGTRTTAPVAAALARTTRLLEQLGHHVEDTPAPLGVSWDRFVAATVAIWTSHLAVQIDALAEATGRPVSPRTLETPAFLCHAFGRTVTGPELADAVAVRDLVARALGTWFSEHDLLLTPTLPELPRPVGPLDQDLEGLDGHGWVRRVLDSSPFTAPVNAAGTPAISVPLERDPATGLPVGLQFAAAFGREDLLLQLAGQLERTRPWAEATPPTWAGR